MSTDVQREELSDGTIRLASGRHVVMFKTLAPNRMLLSVHGIEEKSTRSALMRELEGVFAKGGGLSLYIDSRNTPRIDASGRDEWGEFGKKHRAALQRVVILVNSKLVEMGMTLLGLFVGGGLVRTLSDEAAFVKEIAKDVPGFLYVPAAMRTPTRRSG